MAGHRASRAGGRVAAAGAHHAGGCAGGLKRLVLHVEREVRRVVEGASHGQRAADVLLVGSDEAVGEDRLDALAVEGRAGVGERVGEVLGHEVDAEVRGMHSSMPIEHAAAGGGRKPVHDSVRSPSMCARNRQKLTGLVWSSRRADLRFLVFSLGGCMFRTLVEASRRDLKTLHQNPCKNLRAHRHTEHFSVEKCIAD